MLFAKRHERFVIALDIWIECFVNDEKEIHKCKQHFDISFASERGCNFFFSA